MDNEMQRCAESHGFTLIESAQLKEINGVAHVMKHDKTSARLLLLKNDDPNKSFSITFKTPAADDTGVFHILEHSVLCGSKKFPVKEPFVNLLKSSMQTFLNAMTFPDKTMYPVASTNEKDLMNLMDVYLDAVFNPKIYDKEEIFEQEGWHYEIEGDDPKSLSFNGVVFNEMKGALSDPDSVLYDTLSAALFPDTTYRFESGGVPASITDLTYEAFLDNHFRHYRPDNSYIILYGDIDTDKFLGFIDERYLANMQLGGEKVFEDGEKCSLKKDPANAGAPSPNSLDIQAPVKNLGVKQEMDTAPENACAAFGYVVGDCSDIEKIYAVDILLDAIMGSNEAPLKKALMSAGIADDCSGAVMDSIAQPFAMIQLKGLKADCSDGVDHLQSSRGGIDDSYDFSIAKAADIISNEVKRLSEGALDKQTVEAALSHAEFVMRERNYGYPDGVVFSMIAMNGWLYDEDMPYSYIAFEDAFSDLRKKLETTYFEELLSEVFLGNNHIAQVAVIPTDKGEDVELKAKLSAASEALSREDIERIKRSLEKLRAAQSAPDLADDLGKLPKLELKDIGDAPKEPVFELREFDGTQYLAHDIETSGIAYINHYFNLDVLTFDEVPYASILGMILGKLDTENFSAFELDTAIQGKLGNLSFIQDVFERDPENDDIPAKFTVSLSAIDENIADAADILFEVLYLTDFGDTSKIKDILVQNRISMERAFANAGNSVAVSRAGSYCWKPSVLREQLSGVDFYLFLKDLIERFDECADDLVAKLKDVLEKLLSGGNLLSFAGERQALESYVSRIGVRADEARITDSPLSDKRESGGDGSECALIIPDPLDRHEAIVVPTDVTYTSLAADRNKLDSPFSGAWLVAAKAMTLDFLWNEVRVMGGAYGVGFSSMRPGMSYFYSYRDPHIDETIERFDRSGEWLSDFDPSKDEFVGYVVSSVASFDNPQKPRALMRRQDNMFFSGYTLEECNDLRSQVIATTIDDVKRLGSTVSEMCSEKHICTVGNEAIIRSSDENFEIIELMS